MPSKSTASRAMPTENSVSSFSNPSMKTWRGLIASSSSSGAFTLAGMISERCMAFQREAGLACCRFCPLLRPWRNGWLYSA
ncbi:unnamed protein product [Symbiodinium necroappetens]|uniref:Uncharacterized protein n=1 Tax=Symbiodinium necroappetens TaxID=1628268 RepID=A0A812PDR4_9DINO|nr:unnamed protein product [Symbiodinium necroappetens]